MTVRPARPADAPALRALQSTLAEPAPALLAAALDGGPARAFVAADPDPVGYALVVPGPDEVYLAELVVAPARRREGHGSALLAHLAARYPDRPLRLVVRAGDRRARRFYDARGFAVEARLPDRFGDEDGLLLVRRP